PFSNVGGDSTRQAFCDGLVETLTSKLTQLEQFHGSLWVVPASEVFRNRILSPSEARQAFGANLVITGSLQRLGETFRLTLNLVEPENLRQLNSAVVDVQASNLSTLQDDAVTNVLQMLNLELNPQSRRVIQAGISPVPDAYNFYLQGLGYLQRYENVTNLEAATTLFELAIQQDSTYALAYAGLGEAFWRRYKATRENRWVARAMEASRQAQRLDPRLPEVNISLGMILAGTGRYREAIASFQQALDVDPTNAAAYRGLARAHEALGDVNRAEVIYHRAIQFKPDYWGGYNDLGVFYFRHGWYEKAIHQFRRVVELTPDNPRGYSNLGGVYYQLKRWTEARQMFERSLALKKTYRVCSNLATLHYIEGKYARAARMYEMALELNRNDYRVWANLASAYQWSGEGMEKVQQTYRTAIQLAEREKKINPQDVDVVSHLASYYAMIHEDTKALAAIAEALSLAPNDIRVMYRVAGAYEQMGAREQALKWLIKALEQGYSYAEVRHQPELQQLLADER
ncbi:MAG: tetratricopeptide repeat protein, partial [Calditrichaeota bacterium]